MNLKRHPILVLVLKINKVTKAIKNVDPSHNFHWNFLFDLGFSKFDFQTKSESYVNAAIVPKLKTFATTQ